MQTERVTFLTSPDHKAALDAFAAGHKKSVGHVVREATDRYMAGGMDEDETALSALIDQVNEAVPRMRADLRDAVAAIEASNARIDAILAADESPR